MVHSASEDVLRGRTLEVDAENVTRVALDLRPFTTGDPVQLAPGEPLSLVQGEATALVPWPENGVLHLGRSPEGDFVASAPLARWYKGSHRAGPFKEAFDGEMMFVYGTAGTEEEQAWAYAKARYDQETWRYRGNGQVDLMPDTEFLALHYAGWLQSPAR